MASSERIVGKDGLIGEAVTIDDIIASVGLAGERNLDPLRRQLTRNFKPRERGDSPIQAAVRRHYGAGEIICEAGAYGATAFLIKAGSAVATVPEHSSARPIANRSQRALAFLKDTFARHFSRDSVIDEVSVGEVSAYASMDCPRPPLAQRLEPGDLFGIDACINFYPREATVRAGEDGCEVIEMLRSVFDSLRAGPAGAKIRSAYERRAIIHQLHLSPLFVSLSGEQIEALAKSCKLMRVPDSQFYQQGDVPDHLYLIRAGTVQIRQKRGEREVVLSYLGRGSAFGLEHLGAAPAVQWSFVSTSDPDRFAERTLTGPITVGRDPDCNVVIADRTVSKIHFRIEPHGDTLQLVHLSTSNPTFLNGESVGEAELIAGDTIQISAYTFQVRSAAAETTSAGPLRVTSAAAIDNFEVVAVPIGQLTALQTQDPRLFEAATRGSQALRARVQPGAELESPLVPQLQEHGLFNSQNVLLIDLDRCTRCDECVRACATAHDGVARFTRDGPRIDNYLVTLACRSCTDPKCMIGCPVGSIQRLDSLEIHIEDWCVGCGKCSENCPYGNINMIEVDSPGRTADPLRRATVCDLCAGHAQPNCVYACPHDAAFRVNPREFFSLE